MSSEAGLFALIGAGPSLDYCDTEISDLLRRGAHFFISDSIASGFLRRWRPRRASVFTVENRRHMYIHRISGEVDFSVLAYQGANARNLRFTKARVVSQFKITGESGELPMLHSPGTVFGVMLSCAATVNVSSDSREIHLLGADLSYIDNQVYCRYIDDHTPPGNRLLTRELWQFEIMLKKSSVVHLRAGYAIRTGFELAQSRENLCQFVKSAPKSTRFIEYSPLGLETPDVERRFPARS
ncbi:hypothetical protein [Turneriella parva]|uniref:Uncharacterized protein n=1 Tax=Turneriella parva (strain ATCC BAA-1111 / DSM 21527 / NCTC 11395 / H) TaxID=869212 RepID=I4B766_TURPD|nr:hypothetical protein [Turneriella parva]AFM13123.1 hypothetical protein Turpa_2481 [Turneriella parva DSM 21527]